MQIVSTDTAPRPSGHYSQAVIHNGLVFVSGQLPHDPANPDAPGGDIEHQVERAMRNVEAILKAAGSGLDRLLSVTIYISDIAMWPRVNAAYAQVMGEHRPARAIVPVSNLSRGYRVEIQAIGAVGA